MKSQSQCTVYSTRVVIRIIQTIYTFSDRGVFFLFVCFYEKYFFNQVKWNCCSSLLCPVQTKGKQKVNKNVFYYYYYYSFLEHLIVEDFQHNECQ